jgi:small subunit ribosomal protein S19
MSRSLKKGPYVDEKLMLKVMKQKDTNDKDPIKTWARRCTIVPEFVSHTFMIHNGRQFQKLYVIEDMVGHKLGEFAPTRIFRGHGQTRKEAAPTGAAEKQ